MLTFNVRSSRYTRDEMAKLISSRHWFHSFRFDNGLTTPASDPSDYKLEVLGLSDIVKGRTVIDIGAFDGYFAFACEALGASRVVACDHHVWHWPGNDSRGNIEFVRDILQSNVSLLDCAVENLTADQTGVFDVTLFLGVLYHASDPLGYLRKVRSLTREVAVIETIVDMLDVERPALAFYPAATLNGDGSNHFGPNILALEAMLGKVGFSRVELKTIWEKNCLDDIFMAAGQTGPKAWFDSYTKGANARKLRNGRAIIYAYP
jgi:tRNA (mo5U34)-methyltransferase